MKKKQLKNLQLNKKPISNFKEISGGIPPISDWRYGYTCWIPDTLQCNPFSISVAADHCESGTNC